MPSRASRRIPTYAPSSDRRRQFSQRGPGSQRGERHERPDAEEWVREFERLYDRFRALHVPIDAPP
jgi:hypothetical protein